MVLSIIIAAMVAPGLLGSQEAIRQGQSKDKREEHRARRCNLIANCITPSARSREIDGRPVVLRNGKLWIDSGTEDGSPFGHRYAGYYLPYPDTKYEGLVTTITDVAPIMNWVYVDNSTHEVRYGVRADAQPNRTGPFDCTRQDRRLTFDGWEGWCAVEEYPGIWALYFDVDDDGLKSKVASGTRVLELELSRKEKKFQKETDARQQDQTTKRDVDTKQDAPVDRPVAVDPEVQRPGVFGFENTDEPKQSAPGDLPGPVQQVSMPAVETEVQEPPMPKTPPPAYSRNEEPEPEGADVTPSGLGASFLSRQEQEDLTPVPSTRVNKSSFPATPPLNPTSDSQSNRSSPSRLPLQPTPSSKPNASPTSTRPASQSTSSGDKRNTPKLNRNSGNRAMSQAQMFDALDAAKKASEDMLAMVRSRTSRASNRTSRASSGAGSISVYSDDEKRQSGGILPQSNASQKRPEISPQKPEGDPRGETPQETSREKTPSPVDPAVFGTSSRTEKTQETPLGRIKTASTFQRKSATNTPRDLTSRRPASRVTAPRPPSFSSSSRTPTRASLASTMSTGAGKQPAANRAQSATNRTSRANSVRPADPGRVGQNAGGNTRLRTQSMRKTTSTLLRDLDDLVGQEGPVPAPLNAGRKPSAPSDVGGKRALPVRGNPRAGADDVGKKQFSRDK